MMVPTLDVTGILETTPLETGDVVFAVGGKYAGAFMTYVGKADGWFVCLNSYGVGGFVRVRMVGLHRKADPNWRKSADPVMVQDLDSRIAFAQSCTGAK